MTPGPRPHPSFRLFAFLSQILAFADADIEKLYVFARLLRRCLPAGREELPREIQQNIDMESYRIRESFRGRLPLERGGGEVHPVGAKGGHAATPPEEELLSQILRELNERFGTDFTEEDFARFFVDWLFERFRKGLAE